jgi:hypothetical protein
LLTDRLKVGFERLRTRSKMSHAGALVIDGRHIVYTMHTEHVMGFILYAFSKLMRVTSQLPFSRPLTEHQPTTPGRTTNDAGPSFRPLPRTATQHTPERVPPVTANQFPNQSPTTSFRGMYPDLPEGGHSSICTLVPERE